MTATADRDGVLERYEPVIGIEIHCQLRTASKMFCGCSNAYADAAPNTHVCPVCLALPGSLPVVNRRAVEGIVNAVEPYEFERIYGGWWDYHVTDAKAALKRSADRYIRAISE